MAEENANTMNLDLNLGPVDSGEPPSGPYSTAAMNLADWLDSPVHRVREVVRHRNRRWRSLWRQIPIPPETRNLALELVAPQTGEASVGMAKMCENTTASVEKEDLGKRKDGTKGNGDEGSFFDCNVCFHLAKDPVVTCCGHLFCWPCLYQWLHHHSEAKECPVCKGEVTTKNITPIYGRGNPTPEPDLDPSLKIPPRPHARRIESWRQAFQRTANAFTFPMEEMIRRLGSAFDLNRDLAQIQSRHSDDSLERTNVLLSRFLTSRGMRGDDAIEARDRDRSRFSSMLLRRSSSHREAEGLAAVEQLYFHGDDRDSVSSIVAVIHSESQTVDNAVESTLALSTSSSRRRRRRRSDASRISDVDSGESEQRRRLS